MTAETLPDAGAEQGETLQGHYAGPVTRLVAFALDQAVVVFSFAFATAAIAWAVSLVTDGDIEVDTNSAWFTVLAYGLWAFTYYAYPWSVSGKSFGMAVLGIRVVAADGSPCSARSAVLRAASFPLAFLTLGIGFLPILFGRHRRAIYDGIAGTAVVYSWDARAARWRFLAREGSSSRSSAPAQR